jgi:hypothetical protein
VEGSGSHSQQAKLSEARKHLILAGLIDARAPCNLPNIAKAIRMLAKQAGIPEHFANNLLHLSFIVEKGDHSIPSDKAPSMPEMLNDLKVELQRNLESKIEALRAHQD